MSTNHHGKQGFTLVEVSVAAALMLIAMAMSMAGLRYAFRGTSQNATQDELDVDVQVAMERLKRDLRMTSLDEIVYWPEGPGPYTALSFPMARDDDGDGSLEFDSEMRLEWDQTRIYHVWPAEPHELRMTTFDPRDPDLTDVQRREQLNLVVEDGHGGEAPNGDNASTFVVFKNLFWWRITSEGATVDGYAPELGLERVSFGSCVLAPGSHTFRFTVVGVNQGSSDYRIGLDSLYVSPSYGQREAEAQLPVTEEAGATAARQYMAAGSWGGNHHLLFPATDTDQYFVLTMDSDRWEETNFDSFGQVLDNTVARFDETLNPYDFVVGLEGMGTNWSALLQTGDTNGISSPTDALVGAAVRVPVMGEEMFGGGWIQSDARRCRVMFSAGNSPLGIMNASIAEAASAASNGMDAVAGSVVELTFAGHDFVGILGDGDVWSDYADLPIEKERSYLVSFLVVPAVGGGTARQWHQIAFTNVPGCYVIPRAANPSKSDMLDPVWSVHPDVQETNMLFGVRHLFGTYAPKGIYESRIFDTHMIAPQFSGIDWHADVPSGAGLSMRVRAGYSNDLSDAAAWSNVTVIASPGPVSPGDKRYVQFMAELTSDSSGLVQPRLKDVTLKWPGPEQVVHVGGTIGRGPDYGIFSVEVDGKKLSSGIDIELEIFKDSRGFAGTRRIVSSLRAEINSRNTGR